MPTLYIYIYWSRNLVSIKSKYKFLRYDSMIHYSTHCFVIAAIKKLFYCPIMQKIVDKSKNVSCIVVQLQNIKYKIIVSRYSIYVYIYIYIYICLCVCIYIYICVCVCVCMLVYIYVCVSVCMCVFVKGYIYIYIYICVCETIFFYYMIKEYSFTLKKRQEVDAIQRKLSIDDAYELTLLAKIPAVLYSLQHAVGSIGFYVNGNKTEKMHFKPK